MEKLLENVEETERHRLCDEENVISESWSYQHFAWEHLRLPSLSKPITLLSMIEF
jgi:hypothetical protein